MSKQTPAAPVKSNSVDDFSSPMLTSLEMLRSASRESNDAAEPPPTHGLLVPSKKRTNSSYAYTMLLCGFTFHVCYRRDTPRGERVYWRCQLRGQCKARLITDIHGRIVVFTNPEHSHPSTANGLEMSAARRRQHAAMQKTNSEREDETKEKKPKEEEEPKDTAVEEQHDQRNLDQTVREIYEKIAAESRSAEAKRPRGVLDCLERSTTFDDSFLGVETPSMGSSVVSSTSVVFPEGNLSTIDRLLIQQNSEGYGSFADEEEDERHEAGEADGRELPELLEEDEAQEGEPKEEEAAEAAVEEAISDEESTGIESEEEDEDAHSPPTSTNGSEINLEDVWNQISLLQTFNFGTATNDRNDRKPKKKAAVDIKADEIVAERMHKIPLETAEAIGEAAAHSGVPSTNPAASSPVLQFENGGLKTDDRKSKNLVDSTVLLESVRASGWSLSLAPTNNTRQQLWKSFRFADFNAAFGFMSRVALRAAALRAFPEWTNSAGVVHVRLPRDGRREIRPADLQLAAFMDRICGEQT
ncbi:putative pterin-4-alpha-carbinolamine dehydratase [Aphelenchoides fujianensis]|nr:putative pterin-4-alpha-carbinolamine dehydratase [Aphelenchoides fujianensis]